MSRPSNYRRPVLVWIISFFYFIKTAAVLLSLALIPLLFSGAIPINDTQRRYFESQSSVAYFVGFLPVLINLSGAILLFLLRRPALYCFGSSFILVVLNWGYQLSVKGWLAAAGNNVHLIPVFCGLILNLAILIYVRHLFASKILR